jgi:DNA-binding IclR family transcriptional regulator
VLCSELGPADREALADVLREAHFSARTLADVRRRGWAQSIAEREAGVASVSAPVRNPAGAIVAALSISGPIERLGRSPGARYAAALGVGAQRITAALSR